MRFPPSRQVRVRTGGVIVHVQHLTPTGARRIPVFLEKAEYKHARFQVGDTWGFVWWPETYTAAGASATFGGLDSEFAPLIHGLDFGFVDLTRTDPRTAADVYGRQVGPWPPDPKQEGLLVVVTGDGVHRMPLPGDPARLPDHIHSELTAPPARPVTTALRDLVTPALAAGGRVHQVQVPAHTLLRAATEWGGAKLVEKLRRPADSRTRYLYSTTPGFLLGDLPVYRAAGSVDEITVTYRTGSWMKPATHSYTTSCLFAHPDQDAAPAPEAERLYRDLRAHLPPGPAREALAGLSV